MGSAASASHASIDLDLQKVLQIEQQRDTNSDLKDADLEELKAHISKYRQTAVMLNERIKYKKAKLKVYRKQEKKIHQ